MVKNNTVGFVSGNGLMDLPLTSFTTKSVLTDWPFEPDAVSHAAIKITKLR